MSVLWHILNMGGYAAYVWTAYGLTAAVFGMTTFWIKQRNTAIQKKFESLNR